MSAWSVLADAGVAVGASYPCFWASWKAGWRYAEWRDLIRQERAIDRAEAEGPPVHSMSIDEFVAKRREIVARRRERQNAAAIRDGRGVVSLDVPPPPVVPPPAPTASGGVGDRHAASILPLIIHPDYAGDLEDLMRMQGFRPDEYAEVRDGTGRLVRVDSPELVDWGEDEQVRG